MDTNTQTAHTWNVIYKTAHMTAAVIYLTSVFVEYRRFIWFIYTQVLFPC